MSTFDEYSVRWLALIASSTDHDRFAVVAEKLDDAVQLMRDVVSVLPEGLAPAVSRIGRTGRTCELLGRRVYLIGGRNAEERLRGLTLRGLWLHGSLPTRVENAARWRVQGGEVFVSASAERG